MKQMEVGDAALVARARAGDESALQGLVERHSRAVFRLAYRMTRNEQDAEDVVQETFLKAFKRLDQFEDKANFGSWIYRIAANCSYDTLRGRARRESRLVRDQEDQRSEDQMQQVPTSEPSPERLVLSGELRSRVGAAMARLSDRERSAFVLRHFEQMSTREIATILGLDEGAAKHSVFRAVKKLRIALEQYLPQAVKAEAS